MILLDLDLPGAGSIEMLKHLRENDKTRYLPVVVLTRSREEQDVRNPGANSYIQKQVDVEKLQEAMHQMGCAGYC